MVIVERAGLDFSGPTGDPGRAGAVQVAVGFGKGQGHPVIGKKHDEGRGCKLRFVQRLEEGADRIVATAHRAVILGDFFTNLGKVGKESGDSNFMGAIDT